MRLGDRARDVEAEARARLAACRLTRPNCSKISSWCSGAIPSPWSVTATTTRPFERRRRTSTAPPGGENLTALSIRFESTCRSRAAVAVHVRQPGLHVAHDDARAASRLAAATASPTSSATSTSAKA